jgi:hypothetical protein
LSEFVKAALGVMKGLFEAVWVFRWISDKNFLFVALNKFLGILKYKLAI